MTGKTSFFCFILLLCFIGCRDSRLGTLVYGTVSIDGKPIESGIISFVGVEQNPQPYPITKGKYKAHVSPGEHNVSFVSEIIVSEVPRNEYPGDMDLIREYESIIPDKYKKKGATTLVVGEKKMRHDFELTSN